MTKERLKLSIRLFLIRSAAGRAEYLKKHDILGGIGENCRWGPWFMPLYPKLIKLHDNVTIHKTVKLVPHDMVNTFLKRVSPESDFGASERVGCIEFMDNVYVSMYSTIMPNVRIGKNSMISSHSVVTSDIPENTIAAGNPAKPVGRFDMFLAMRRMTAKQNKPFVNQYLPDERAAAEWEAFYNKRDK